MLVVSQEGGVTAVHVLLHVLGLDDASGGWYLWWSGFVGDLGELAIVGGLVSVYRRHNCEVHGCPRLGRHESAAGHRLCRRHHPEGPLTVQAAHEAHHRVLRAGGLSRMAEQVGELHDFHLHMRLPDRPVSDPPPTPPPGGTL